MPKTAKREERGRTNELSGSDEDYFLTLETVQKQYEQYVEVSELYKLPSRRERVEISHQQPGHDNPLTSNVVQIR